VTQPFGLDLSKHNTSEDGTIKVDFDAIHQHLPKVLFIAARCTISWGYKDKWFPYYWENMKRIAVGRMAYHVEYPAESPIRQMDNFFSGVVKPNWDHDRAVVDAELDHGQTKYQITKCTNHILRICKSETGQYPLLYARAEWVNRFLEVADLPPSLNWYMAQYLKRRRWPPYLYTPEHPGPPDIPIGVGREKVLIHQTAEWTKSIGKSGRRYMDYNRWLKSITELLAYFNFNDSPTPVPEPPNLLEEINFLAQDIKTLAIQIEEKTQ